MAPPKEPTKHQLSSRLRYSQHTPAFLRKLQGRVSGVPDQDSDEDPEFEDDGSGRPPIPRRPPIPERPANEPGSADEEEDKDDEAPQVVVLKQGKHLSAWEVENEKRKAKGLPPLPDPSAIATPSDGAKNTKAKKMEASSNEKKTLSFSSGSSLSSRPTTAAAKRKAALVGDGRSEDEDADHDSRSRVREGGASSSSKVKAKKKPKVGLSFADDA